LSLRPLHNSLCSTHIFPEHIGNNNAPVGLLKVLQDRDHRAAHGKARTV